MCVLAVHDPVKMGAIGFLAGEDGLARRRQALGLLPPVRVGRNPGQLDFPILRNVLEGARASMCRSASPG